MPYRVREVLLVSSPYDAFALEEDGRLTERLFLEYSELNLPSAPRITHASSGSAALETLDKRRFDLVITMTRLEDLDVFALAAQIKAVDARLPVVVLGANDAEIADLVERLDPNLIDGVFVWTGNASILVAVIKLIEDAQNVAHDIELADVRVILVVEDSVRRYSGFLSILYHELMGQASSLVAEGINEIHKVTRMRARPKILLATTFEEAMRVLETYEHNVHAVLSDVRFPREGIEDPEAGFRLLEFIRSRDPDLPVLLQSAEPDIVTRAKALNLASINKNSPRLNREIRHFVKESMGFGDFIFRRPDRTEVARAHDLYEMEDILHSVPSESIRYHAEHRHFSRWLVARTLFHIGKELKFRTIDDFGGVEGLREHCIGTLRQARIAEQQGMITNFSEHHVRSESPFVRLGRGSIGGKARGLAFINSMLARSPRLHHFEGLKIRTPRTVALGTDIFDAFLECNGLADRMTEFETDEAMLQAFLKADFPEKTARQLKLAWQTLVGPLAVRSSSLLEDGQFEPFAGIYSTYKLTNQYPDTDRGFAELCQAVKAVYASTFSKNAQAYIDHTPYTLEDEKMGVLIQELVGQHYDTRFYPSFSGVAVSYNFYPAGGQTHEDGLVVAALGLGHHVVQGGRALSFSPKSPKRLPQFRDAEDFYAHSQSEFWALDMSKPAADFEAGPEAALQYMPLSIAEKDGVLATVGSVYDAADDVIRDDLRRPGPRVVTFNNILKYGALPLAGALETLLDEARHGLGGPVEIEFAVDAHSGAEDAVLYVLQVRPQAKDFSKEVIDIDLLPDEDLLAKSQQALGHGMYRELYDIIYVRHSTLDPVRSHRLAHDVGVLDAQLRKQKRPYILVGPGRWGSSDATLGIPVQWSQMAGVRVVVETSVSDRLVEPSQGSHFFHNLTALHLAYLCAECLSPDGEESFIDIKWLDAQPAGLHDTDELRHVRLESPVVAYLDGTTGRGALVKPGYKPQPVGSTDIIYPLP